MSKKTVLACVVALTALCLLGTFEARSQSVTAQMSGRVTDASGASVPEANVTITNVDTGVARKVATNAEGYYVIPLLPPGNYSLTVAKAGFEPVRRPNLTLAVNQAMALDVVLAVGGITQEVVVTGAADQLEATSSDLGAVISEKAVVDLPLNGRNFTQLLTLTPGATPVSTGQSGKIGGGNYANPGLPTSSFSQPSVNGQWNRSNFYLMDGVNDTAWFASTYSVLPIIDAIQEFKVQSHNDDVQFGGVTGGILNVVTKSGTNQLHGSTWEFVRNSDFDARNPFSDGNSKGPAPYHQNEFGLTLGGPVVIPKVFNGRNKTWFFAAYEGWRFRKPTGSLLRLPTAAELSGDFSQSPPIFDSASTQLGPDGKTYVRTPFPNNVIPGSRISPMTQGVFSALYDTPNFTGIAGVNYLSSGAQRNDNDTLIVKGDQRIGDKDTAWFRYSRMYPDMFTPVDSKVSTIDTEWPVNWGGGETHVFSPNLLLDVRFGYSTRHINTGTVPNAGLGVYQALGYQETSRFGALDLTLQAPWNSLGINGPLNQQNTTYHPSATVTWVRGNHTITAGYQLFWTGYTCCATGPGFGQNYSYAFTNTQTGNPAAVSTSGASLASALLGVPAGATLKGIDYVMHYQSWAPYIGDKWRLTPRLTLTLGLRYDYYTTPTVGKDIVSELDPATGNWLIGGGKLPPACSTSGVAPCIPGSGNLASIPYGSKIVVAPNQYVGPNPVNSNWGPRIGLAYQMENSMVVRAGYGIVYDSLNGFAQTVQANIGAWPSVTNSQSTVNAIGQPITTVAALDQAGASFTPAASPWSSSNYMYDPDGKNMRSQQWNLEVQRQLTSELLFSVGYVGSRTDRLPVTGLFNVSPLAGLGAAGVPFPWATTTLMNRSIGEARYSALQVKAEKRYARGLQFLVSYTWSRVMENGGSGFYSVENGAASYSATQNFADLSHNWGPAAYDVPQYFSAAIQYDLPAGKNKAVLTSGLLSHILGNWQVNTVTTLRSGQPFNLLVQGDAANIFNKSTYNYERPNVIGNPLPSQPTAQQYFNTSAFAVPVNSFGNMGQDALRSSSVYLVDFSLFRTIPIKDTSSLQLRAEVFNVFNIQNLGVPGVTMGTSALGVVSSVVGFPREIQLSLKFRF
jgi:outer membrane receptor protein involved in Fe transport